ncbi:MAG: hypothetical protein ABIU63_09715 [Chitinophagaceae bacterium]
MKQNIAIQIKAAFLLIVFSMNTVIGFACAMGVDMGFNNKHHHDKEETAEIVIHVHADGKKHQHHDKTAKHHHGSKEESEKGGCCNDGVVQFQSLDKNLNQHTAVVLNVPFFTAVISNFFIIDIAKQTSVCTHKHIVQFFHPPPPDIRILIQSFQI